MKNKEKQIKEIKTEMETLKSSFDKNYLNLENKLKKLEKGIYEIGDILNWCGFDWIVIEILEDNKVKLMSKDIVKTMTYSDNNSNDFKDSNVKKYLGNEFISKLDKSKLIEMKTNYDEDKFIDTLVRIPTLRDIEALPMSIRNRGNAYWTMSSSYGVSEDCSYAVVWLVDGSGCLGDAFVDGTNLGVRPVIILNTETL